MEEWKKHNSNDKSERKKATPIVFFERIKKGYLQFHGVGILEKVSLITQRGNESEFTNFEFEFCILDLSKENNLLDWDWISDRCNKVLNIDEANKKAPESWKYWINNGNDKIEKVSKNSSYTRLYFCNGSTYDVEISYEIIQRQLFNCQNVNETCHIEDIMDGLIYILNNHLALLPRYSLRFSYHLRNHLLLLPVLPHV